MNIEPYSLGANDERTIYVFTSTGPKGEILKGVAYSLVDDEIDTYNLGLGDLKDGKLDDKSRTNNGDVDKVLRTVAETAIDFLQTYPTYKVSFLGNTDPKHRLYRRKISVYLEEIKEDYKVAGWKDNKWCDYEPDTDYERYLIANK